MPLLAGAKSSYLLSLGAKLSAPDSRNRMRLSPWVRRKDVLTNINLPHKVLLVPAKWLTNAWPKTTKSITSRGHIYTKTSFVPSLLCLCLWTTILHSVNHVGGITERGFIRNLWDQSLDIDFVKRPLWCLLTPEAWLWTDGGDHQLLVSTAAVDDQPRLTIRGEISTLTTRTWDPRAWLD